MRNLKRALSLALASVMLLGMMVVGTSAASYPDVDENDNVEAIEVLNAVNVMIGDRGNFRPDAAVNRHEMAVIMAKLVLGVETADNYVGTHPFTDVFPWADKYVAACYENGLVAGTSATTFGGNQPLTAVQAAAMMLRALGYKDLSKGQPDWRAPVTAMANQIRLFNGVASNPSEQLTRNQVAQLALNTLKSPMVNLKDNTISWSNDEGQLIMTGGSREYIALSSNEAYARAINDTERAGTSASQISGYTVELGEHLYNGKLKLNNNNLDVFGRPARKWEYDGKAIGSYIKEELMVMDKVGKVTGNDLYTLLGSSTIKDYDTLVTIDGVANDRSDAKDILEPSGAYFDEADMNRNNKKEVGATGTGVLTQVFVDHEKDEVYVAVINTYLARASKDYDTKAEEATLTVYGIDEYRTSKEFVKAKGSSETMKVQNEDFDLVKDVKKDDPYLVTVAGGEIQTMVPDEVLEAVTLTAFKLTDHVVSDGTEYAYTTTATYKDGDLDNYTGIAGNTNLKDMTYNIYLDAYGNLIGIEEVDAVKNYVFLAGIDVDGSNLYSKTATANALFLDGTSKTIKINLSKSEFPAHPELGYTNVVISGNALLNTWCTYTVSGDVYTVKEAYATSANPYSGTTANANNYPQHGDNTTKLAQTWQAMTNTGKVSVKNLRLSGGPTSGNYTNVYGDSTSVYLTAELDELYNDGQSNINGGFSYGIIKGVDSVTTGVADTSIEIWTEAEARTEAEGSIKSQDVGHNSYGIYTLYDSEGIVIASVVIGENEGVKDLVYVHSSSLDLESYDSAKDIWTWTRKVVFNGEAITLTEKGDGVSDLETMKQYQWYEIKRDNDGNILSADPAFHALGEYEEDPDYTIDNTGYFVTRYENINNRVESSTKDTVLYQTSGGPKDYTNDPVCHKHGGLNKDLVVLGSNTLAVETLTGSGIHFRNDVNVVLQYWNQNTKQTEIETGTGVDALKSMVDFVNDNNKVRGGDLYWLSAVIEKGFATTVVIYDSFNNYDRPATELGTYELTLGGVLNSIYTTPANLNSDVYLVDANGNITYVESNDDVATSTVNGYKRYTIPYNETVRIYDNDVGDKDFLPFFSPVWAVVSERAGYGVNEYHIGRDLRTNRYYLEFSISERLTDNKLTVRERLSTDPIYVGVVAGSKAKVTINGKDWDAKNNCFVASSRMFTVKSIDGASVYVNGMLLTPDAGTTDTYTIDASNYAEYIIISTAGGAASSYAINKAAATNGTVTVASSAAAGATVTVTATPADGYELDKITVTAKDGTNVTVTGSTFVMPAQDVTVTVTFKSTDPNAPVSVTIVPGKGTAPVDLFREGQAVSANDIRVGDKISLDPAEVLEFTAGVSETADENGWYTVTGGITIDLKDGWRYMLGWYWDAQGNMYTPAAAAMAAYARVSAPGWVAGVMQGKVYNVKAILADGTEIVWTLRKNDSTGKIQLLPPAGINNEQLAASEEAFAGVLDDDYVIEESGTEVTNVYVDITAGAATFTQYVPEGQTKRGALTVAEVEALLKEKTGKEYKVNSNNVDTGKATASDGTEITFASVIPTQVYKVSYPGGEKIADVTGKAKVTGITGTAKWLVASDKPFAATGVAVNDGAAELTVVNNKDTKYEPAVMLQNTSLTDGKITATGGGSDKVIVYIATGGTPSLETLKSANHKYIKVGAELQFQWDGDNTGEDAIGLSVNGTVKGSVSPTSQTGSFKVEDTTKGNLLLTAAKNAAGNDTKVFLNDVEVTDTSVDTDGNKWVKLAIPSDMKVLTKDKDGKYSRAEVTDDKPRIMGMIETKISEITDANALSADGKSINLYTGYEVEAYDDLSSNGYWQGYLKLDDAKKDGATADITSTSKGYVPAGTTIYVKSKAGELLTDDAATATKIEELAGRQAIDTTSGDASTWNYIYAVNVTKNIAKNNIGLFGTFQVPGASSANWAVTVADKTASTSLANCGKDNITVTVADGTGSAKDFFKFKDAANGKKSVLDAATTGATDIVAQVETANSLVKTGNKLDISKITISGSTESTKENLLVVAIDDASAKRAAVDEVYDVTFQINGVPVKVPVTFKAHVRTTNELSAEMAAVAESAQALANYTGTGANADRGPTSPAEFEKTTSGANMTLTAKNYTATDDDQAMLTKWFKGNTDKGMVVAISIKVPVGAVTVNDKSLTGEVDDNGNMMVVVKISKTDIEAGTKSLTLTWKDGAGTPATIGTTEITFNLANVTWGGTTD